MRRFALFWAPTGIDTADEIEAHRILAPRLRNTIDGISRLDTAWIDLIIEVPEDSDIGELRRLVEERGSLDWLHFSPGPTEQRNECRLRLAEQFEAEAIGFLEGNEILPKDAVFRWLEARELTQQMLEEYGVLLTSLPAGTVISPNLYLDNVHHVSFTAATVAFFEPKHLQDLIETPRTQWLRKYVGVSNHRGGKILAACQDASVDEIVSVKSARSTTQTIFEETAEKFEIEPSVLTSFWANS